MSSVEVFTPSPYDAGPHTRPQFKSGVLAIDSLIDLKGKFGGPVGTGAVISFSFPDAESIWADPYEVPWRSLDEPNAGFRSFSEAEKAIVRVAFQEWENVANIKFVEITETATSVGDIRFAHTANTIDKDLAHSSSPHFYPRSSDIWWNSSSTVGVRGTTSFSWLLHEIGHAIGFKHPFSEEIVLPRTEDNWRNTVMSYTTSFPNPTSPRDYDIQAVTYLYGAKGSSNKGVEGDYEIFGSLSSDRLEGLSGNDYFHPFTGSNEVLGGRGHDIVQYDASREEFFIEISDDGFLITNNDNSIIDYLVGIEGLSFTDNYVSLEVLDTNNNDVPDYFELPISPFRVTGARNIRDQGTALDTAATFSLEMTFLGNDVPIKRARLSQSVSISAEIAPEPEAINETADIIIVNSNATTGFTMRDESGNWIPRDGKVPSLVPYLRGVPLEANMELEIFSGMLGIAGSQKIYMGFLVNGDTLFFNAFAMTFEIIAD